jgi:hypothetical protein
MKYTLRFFAVMVALMIMRCSEENIEPALLDDDPSTHMEGYYPSTVFAIEVTTILGGRVEENGLPQLTEFYLSGDPGAKVKVNWGDGTIEKVTLDESRNYMSHQYTRIKNYNIQVSGEISKITTFGIYYQHIIIRDVYLSGLVNLKRLSMGLNYRSPSIVNFSHNRKIETIDFSGSSELTDIIVPSENRLTTVLLSGPNSLSTAVVDRIISRVYTSVQASPRAGYIALNENWGEESPGMIGPPSDYSITKLRKLRDVYGWEVTPELQETPTSGHAITFKPSATDFNMWMHFTGKGTVTLDWGKGDTEVIDFDVDPENQSGTAFRAEGHTYATSIPPAKITGDIHLLVGLLFDNAVDALNVEFATGLKSLEFTDADMPKLDLSANSGLEALSFNNTTIADFTLPQQHAINFFSINEGELGPRSPLVDYVISNIHANTVAGNRMGGFMELDSSPISSDSKAKVIDLRNTYGWEIAYE